MATSRKTTPSARTRAPAKKAVVRRALETATRPPAKPSVPAPVPPESAARLAKQPKPRLVRDSFTMPASDFALIATLKERALGARREAKKSELLRAGLQALAALDSNALVAALGRLQPLKLGRPKKH